MQLHQLRPKTRPPKEKRVGRGDKTAGRGTKGQKARAGAKIRPAIRDLLKKLPKRRGYNFRPFRPKPVIVDLATIGEHFSDGATVNAKALLEKRLVDRMKGKIPEIKILGRTPLKKRFIFRGLQFSKATRVEVEEAGGTIHP